LKNRTKEGTMQNDEKQYTKPPTPGK